MAVAPQPEVPLGPSDAQPGYLPKYYIPASASLAQLLSRTIKQGDTFAVFDECGDIAADLFGAHGLFHEDARHLSRYLLRLDGRRPLLLSSGVREDNAVLTIDQTNPDIYDGDRLVLERDTVHLHRAKFLWNGACHERIALRNYGNDPLSIALSLEFGADFADLFEVRGHTRPRRGENSARRAGRDSVALRYAGLDGRERVTRLVFDPVPARLDQSTAEYAFDLDPGAGVVLFVSIACGSPPPVRAPRRSFFSHLREARRVQRRVQATVASVETSNSIFNEMLCRSVSDLYMLLSPTEHGWYPYAGIPWFSAPFGRDGIITAIETLWLDPNIARGVLRYLAATQAAEIDPASDAEPGKILHETRKGEMALLGEVPFRRYYGSVDATPLFVLLAGMYLRRTGDTATIEALWPAIEAALGWIARFGDIDGDGFVEYQRKTESGLANQGWKDSHDSIFHADGKLAEGPIALCEVQGYVYAAKSAAAEIARGLGMSMVAATLETEAIELREKFEARFWCEEIGLYALALDGEKRQCRVRASNAGQVLFTGIAAPERAARVAETLMAPAGFSGWGIRTLMSGEARYNPMSYHNGSIWPHDNALIALGLARYGLKQPVVQILDSLFQAAIHLDLRRLPELFCGFPRAHRGSPTFYPVACAPQAWASAAPLCLLQACLGLELDHAAGEIRFRTPTLPRCLEEVLIRNLRLGESVVTVLLRRHDDEVSVTPLDRTGEVRVVTVA